MCQDANDVANANLQKTYNEPVTRDLEMKEFIPRMNPVDIKEYISEDEPNELSSFHVTHKNSFSQNNLPHRELYSLKDIENILNVDNLLEKTQNEVSTQNFFTQNNYQYETKYKDTELIYQNENETSSHLKRKKISAKQINKPSAKKQNENKEEKEPESILNIIKTKKERTEMREKAGKAVDDFLNSIKKTEKAEKKNDNKKQKQGEPLRQEKISHPNTVEIKVNKRFEENSNSENSPPKKKGELIEVDFGGKGNKEVIRERFLKERERNFEEFKKQKEDNEKHSVDEEKFSKEALYKKRQEMVKKKDFKKK